MSTKEGTLGNKAFKAGCLILLFAAAGRREGLIAAEPPDPIKILEAVTTQQDRLLNHHIRFTVQVESREGQQFAPTIYVRTVFQDKARLDQDRQAGLIRSANRWVFTPPLVKNYQAIGGEKSFVGSIRKLNPGDYLSRLNDSAFDTWLFGVASGDSAHAWRLMAEFPERVSASEAVVDGARRIRLSANLPGGHYELEVEPDRQYRLRRFSFEKLHSEGHFPPVSADRKQYLPEGADHFEEFVRGTVEFDDFIESHGLWFPSSGRYVYAFHSTDLDEPFESVRRVQVQEFEMLLEPPPPETFEINWPPQTQVRDETQRDPSSEPTFYAGANGQLKRFKMLAVGDPVPLIEGNMWFEASSTIDLADLEEKHVFIYIWATWCGPCMTVLPKIQKLYEEFRDAPKVIIMGINGFDEGAKLDRFMREKSLTFPQLVGEDARAAMNVLGSFGAGGGLLIGPHGRVIELDSPLNRLREILAQQPQI